jgi:hypothetical protein
MKVKHIIICALILAALICIFFLRNLLAPKAASKIELASLGSDIEVENVRRIEFYAGADQNEGVELEKKEGAWVAPAKFDAPAQAERIKNLLQDIKGLSAEMRSDSAELFSEFAIGDSEAVHIILYGAGETTLHHLLLGKESAGGSGVFVRLQGESKIYAVDKNLRRKLGIFDSTLEGAKSQLKPEGWLDLRIFPDLKNEDVVKISLTSPGRYLVFERKPVETSEQQKEGEKKQEPKTEWVLSDESGPAPFRIKQDGVEQVIPQLKNVNADDVIDPQKEKECGFETATYTVALTFKDKSEKVFVIGNKTGDAKGGRFAKIKGERLIWKIPSWVPSSVSREGKSLLELPALAPDESKLCAITLCDPVKELVIEKVSGTWTVTSPQLPFEPREKALRNFIQRWNSATADDIVNTKDEPDFTNPAYIIELALSDSTRQTIIIGADVPGREKERYISIPGREEIFTIKEQSLTGIFPTVTNLFSVKILECDRNKVESIKLLRTAGEINLRRISKDESAYKGSLLGYEFPANTDQVREILDNLINAVPADVPGKVSAEKSGLDSPEFTLTLKLPGAKELALHIGNKTEKGYFAQTADSPIVYLIPEIATELLARPVSEILNLKVFDFTPASVEKFTLRMAEKEMLFEQNEKGEWVASPEAKPVKQDAVSALLDALSNLCASDVSSPCPLGEVGLEKPEKSITIVTKDGKSNCLSLGTPVPDQKETIYAKLNGKDGLLHLPAAFTQKVFPELETLFIEPPPAPEQEK